MAGKGPGAARGGPTIPPQAEAAKSTGNALFAKGKYAAAIDSYTEAITLAPQWPVPLVNRALCRRKLGRDRDWGAIEADAARAIELDGGNVKAHWLLGVALLETGRVEEAVLRLGRAQDMARETEATIQEDVWRERARAKYLAWQHASAARQTAAAGLRARLLAGLQAGGSSNAAAEVEELMAAAAVGRGDVPRKGEEEAPEYICCTLTMDAFRDPVLTPSGISYERAAILEHLRRVGAWDPVTRKPLAPDMLLPNTLLRAATQAWLDAHPWAYKDIQRIEVSAAEASG